MIKALEMSGILVLAGSALRLLRVKLPRGEMRSFDTAVVVLALWHLGLVPGIAISVLTGAVEALHRRLILKEPASLAVDAVAEILRRLLVLFVVGSLLLVVPNGIEGDGVVAAVLVLGCVHALVDEASHRVLVAAMARDHRRLFRAGAMPAEPVASIYALHILLSSVASRLIALMGVWGTLLPLSILLLLQYGLVMYMRIRLAYSQTIAALSRAIEMALGDAPGSSSDLADLAVRVGKWIGLKSETLENLNYAALLRRIGWIGLVTDTEAAAGAGSPPTHGAERSAGVLSSIEFLRGAATIIAPTVVESGCAEESAAAAQILEACVLYQEEVSASAQPELALRCIQDRLQTCEQVMRALEHEAQRSRMMELDAQPSASSWRAEHAWGARRCLFRRPVSWYKTRHPR
ncbi:hypothetical protein MX659_04230 [Coriobacteriia bacterium Es71-Z0120]|uniref:hypothetical protein n=1 Tax=Parvivirga hydrogeniphila TaxID=2939460 RepID=UPI002260CFD3|nr:hypothetical protein [Parvivirga hydrogeniphila]MCL4078807.1 hypothetical protein [Parvivirga hydrogeniphila]